MLLDHIQRASTSALSGILLIMFGQMSVRADSKASNPPQPLRIGSAGLDDGFPAIPYRLQMTATGGVTPLKWTIVKGNGSLPPGLKLGLTTGLISGTPVAPSSKSFTFTVQVADSSTPPQTSTPSDSARIQWCEFEERPK